jgi:hypothetical protein
MLMPLLSFLVPGSNQLITVSYLSLASIDLISLGRNDGLFLFCVLVTSLILVYFHAYKFLYISGIASLFTLYSTYSTISITLEKLAYDNKSVMHSIQLEAGCIFLIFGSLLLIISSYLAKSDYKENSTALT